MSSFLDSFDDFPGLGLVRFNLGDFRILECNRGFLKLTGVGSVPEDLKGRSIIGAALPSNVAADLSKRLAAEPFAMEVVFRLATPGGNHLAVTGDFRRVLEGGHGIAIVEAVIRTVSRNLPSEPPKKGGSGVRNGNQKAPDGKQTPEAKTTTVAAERAKSFLEAYDGIVYISSRDFRIEYLNERLAERVGKDAIGGKCHKVLFGSDTRCSWCIQDQVLGGKTVRWEFMNPKDGRWFHVVSVPSRHPDGSVSNQSLMMDVTDRKEAEKALQESEERFRLAAEACGQLIYDYSIPSGKIRWAGPIQRITGYPAEDFQKVDIWKWGELIHPDDRAAAIADLDKAMAGGKEYFVEYRFQTRSGKYISLEDFGVFLLDKGGKACRMIGCMRDATLRKKVEEERKSMDAQVRHVQKLESLGILAGGIAHDFNNILMGILGNANLAQLKAPEGSNIGHYLTEIEKASKRAADLCNQMLAYSGRGKFVIEFLDLTRLVEEMGRMIEISLSKKATIRFHLARDLPRIKADGAQIRQIVMNLITNASDALGDGEGMIVVSTGKQECEEGFLNGAFRGPEPLPPGLYVFLEVTDTGIGMSEETRNRIFDPFFTTKQTGRGLGLAAVLGIVRGHSGCIVIESEPGKGSTFRVLFPLAELPSEEVVHETKPAETSPSKGRGTLLLADDDETVRVVGVELLGKLGFEVTVALDGKEALDIFQKSPNAFVGAILDLTMPRMGGVACLQQLRKIRGDLPILLSSGFNEAEVTPETVDQPGVQFLQKPYTFNDLKDTLAQLLKTPGSK